MLVTNVQILIKHKPFHGTSFQVIKMVGTVKNPEEGYQRVRESTEVRLHNSYIQYLHKDVKFGTSFTLLCLV